MDSILISVKKMLGIAPEHTYYDQDIIFHINTILNVLTQIGVGPKNGFLINDETAVWTDFVSDERFISLVKQYVFLRVKLLFDQPQNSSVQKAMEETYHEMEFRFYSIINEEFNYPE